MHVIWSARDAKVLHLAQLPQGGWRVYCWAYTDVAWVPDDSRPDGYGSHLEGTGRAQTRVRLDLVYLPDAPELPICSRCLGRMLDDQIAVVAHLDRVGQELPAV